MDTIHIIGGTPLKGEVGVSGAKNAGLPLMCASLLTSDPITFTNMPHLADISTMASLLGKLGVKLSLEGRSEQGGHKGEVLTLTANALSGDTAPYDIVRKMRASVLVLGPLLARMGTAKVSLPGGCAIGTRPVDMHLSALEEMGAKITLEGGYVLAEAPDGLKGTEIYFRQVSVGATENLLMAASLAKGRTVLHNAAREPEITDLAHCLIAMGAKISGLESDTLMVEGVTALHGCTHAVIPDRIETGTYAAAAIITGGDVLLKNARADMLGAVLEKFRESGATVEQETGGLRVRADSDRLKPLHIVTEPFPGFPTDMQAQLMAMMAVADGVSRIEETIFENRFMHVAELMRMGADIRTDGGIAEIHGVQRLKGANVMATDLRASVSLIIAALAAEGETVIHRVYHLDRGYERIEEKLSRLGAKVWRAKER